MKFINYLESISGIGVYPMVAMMLFLGVFTYAVISVIFTKKETIQEQSQLPLDEH